MPFNYIASSSESEMVLSKYERILSGQFRRPVTEDKNVAVLLNALDNFLQQNGISEANRINIDVEKWAELEILSGATNGL